MVTELHISRKPVLDVCLFKPDAPPWHDDAVMVATWLATDDKLDQTLSTPVSPEDELDPVVTVLQ